MKHLLVMSLVLMLTASMAFAYINGAVVVTTDGTGTDCNLQDVGPPALCSYSIVHICALGSTGCQYKVDVTGHAGTPFPDEPIFQVTIGSAAAGVSIGYGGCLAGTIETLRIQFFCQGTTPACTPMVVEGHPTATPPGLLTVDCSSTFQDARGLTSVLNPDSGCQCAIPDCSQIPVENRSWGAIKSLYID